MIDKMLVSLYFALFLPLFVNNCTHFLDPFCTFSACTFSHTFCTLSLTGLKNERVCFTGLFHRLHTCLVGVRVLSAIFEHFWPLSPPMENRENIVPPGKISAHTHGPIPHKIHRSCRFIIILTVNYFLLVEISWILRVCVRKCSSYCFLILPLYRTNNKKM